MLFRSSARLTGLLPILASQAGVHYACTVTFSLGATPAADDEKASPHAFGADDSVPSSLHIHITNLTYTPSAWMMAPDLGPVASSVRRVGHFRRTLLVTLCSADAPLFNAPIRRSKPWLTLHLDCGRRSRVFRQPILWRGINVTRHWRH